MSVHFVTAADLRLGIIGADTSHATAFTQVLNNPNDPNHVEGAHIVVAWKGGSPDIEESAKRVDQYAAELKDKWGVRIVGSIARLCPDIDGLLLESVDGRPHLEQFRQAIACGEPVFIDKPLASSLADAREIARLTVLLWPPREERRRNQNARQRRITRCTRHNCRRTRGM